MFLGVSFLRCVLLPDELACSGIQTAYGVVMHVPRPFRADSMAGGNELSADFPRFQAKSGGLPSHVFQTHPRRRECAFNQFGKRTYAAFFRCRNGEELLNRILFLRFDRSRETPNERFAQRISFRNTRGIGAGANQRLNLRNRQSNRSVRLLFLLHFRTNLLSF